VRFLAFLFAEFIAPPTMRHQAEPSSAMIADLRLPHTLAQHFFSNKSFDENPSNLNEDCPIGGPQGGYVYPFFLDCRLPQQFYWTAWFSW
jgi:hypothetical protein